MKNALQLILATLLFSSCVTLQKQRAKDWVSLYKSQAFMSCLKEENPTLLNNDISRAINFDVMGSSAANQADSLGRSAYKTILPSSILDLDHKKPVCNSCLDFYSSKELDEAAKKAHKEYLRYNRKVAKI
ncbi:hypothetical protein [Pedobacter sp. GR22-6]|uniref:hypothetical protein n=1 Tax=Pedobacter sp. GR22-6 TaxID=3127957 RepID=UPI00307FCB32